MLRLVSTQFWTPLLVCLIVGFLGGGAALLPFLLWANLLQRNRHLQQGLTELAESRSHLQTSQHRYHELVQNANSLIIRWDGSGRVLDANAFSEKLLGCSLDELKGRPIAELFAVGHSDRVEADKLVQRILQQPEANPFQILQTRNRAGRTLWIAWTHKVFNGTELSDRDVLSIGTDISDRMEIEEELMQARQAARVADHAKGSFLANMSHEIRTPMNGVLGMLELLGRTKLDERQAEYAQIAHESAQNLLHILNDILDFARGEAGRIQLREESFDIRSLVDEAVKSQTASIMEKTLEMRMEVDPAVPAALFGDSARFRQIFFNLLGNAVKFTDRGSVTTRIVCEPAGGDDILLRISVVDTGLGISGEQLPLLFQPFVQGEDGHTRRFGGTGLGLAIVRQIVERMGGEVWVESQLGVGSNFQLAVLVRTARRAQVPQGAKVQRFRGNVVLGDLSVLNRCLWARQLREVGLTVLTCRRPEELLTAFRSDRIDLAVVGEGMVGADWYLVQQLRRLERVVSGAGIVILAVVDHAHRIGEGLRAGAHLVLVNPVDPEKMVEALHSIPALSQPDPAANRAPRR
jgi:PAS domain S-box-containing protein